MMTKRMTAEEVLADLQDELHHATKWLEATSQPFDQGLASGFAKAVDLVRDNLVPQWQGEAVEGPCWVRGVEAVCSVYHWHDDEQPGDGGWSIEYIVNRDDGTSEMRWEPLNGRQVCPIGARPKDGDAHG